MQCAWHPPDFSQPGLRRRRRASNHLLASATRSPCFLLRRSSTESEQASRRRLQRVLRPPAQRERRRGAAAHHRLSPAGTLWPDGDLAEVHVSSVRAREPAEVRLHRIGRAYRADHGAVWNGEVPEVYFAVADRADSSAVRNRIVTQELACEVGVVLRRVPERDDPCGTLPCQGLNVLNLHGQGVSLLRSPHVYRA